VNPFVEMVFERRSLTETHGSPFGNQPGNGTSRRNLAHDIDFPDRDKHSAEQVTLVFALWITVEKSKINTGCHKTTGNTSLSP